MTCYLFSIEGNIGSGKSTFIKYLKDKFQTISGYKVTYLSEPVKEWVEIKDAENETILEKFYKDQKRYSFAFQMMAYISRINQLMETIEEMKQKNKDCIIVTERSVYTDKNVFAKMLYDDGKIESVEYQIYLKWFNSFTKNIQIFGIVYLCADTKVCEERITKRNREGEKMSFDYLNNCNLYHNKWLLSDGNRDNIHLINANTDYEGLPPKDWIKQTLLYIKSKISKSLSQHDMSGNKCDEDTYNIVLDTHGC